MITLKETCDHQPVILQQFTEEGWQPVAVLSDGTPKVFDCVHDAFWAVLKIVQELYILMAIGKCPPTVDLSPEQFRVVPVGPPEPPVEDMSEALDCLSKTMRKS